ncbi:MAG: hypothetical protein IT370_32275 [Deltaproteobacteria bacterium]|nr:hypothetical protein [Deltaproteobacteria bacterium]
MSTISSVFFSATEAAERVVEDLRHLLDLPLKLEAGDPLEPVYVAEALNLKVALVPDPGLEDEDEILFSRYNYHLRFQALFPDDNSDELRRAAAIYVRGRIAARRGWRSIAVENLDVLLVGETGDAQ